MDLKSLRFNELTEYLVSEGYPKFRAKQLYDFMHKKYVGSIDNMTSLPKDMLAKYKDDITFIKEVTKQVSKKDGTIKFLYEMQDGQMIETVFMRYHHGNSICISSQAGCRMGCKFCASTIGGLVRNLTAAEMLEQVYASMRSTGERISNIVVMGTGEPLDNYDNLRSFIDIICSEEGYNISQRNITVSSCGLVPMIKKLADENLQITFALSLHASNDADRKELMPVAKSYTIAETLDACRYYFEKTKRRVTFEYSLVAGKNDSEAQAMELAGILKNMNCHVNLIPINPIEERDFTRSNRMAVEKFKNTLEKNRINVTIRKGMGSDIDAACGQLRRKYTGE